LRQLGQRGFELAAQGLEARRRFFLAYCSSSLGRRAADQRLDVIEFADALDRLFSIGVSRV
jgi:hypothetical protein